MERDAIPAGVSKIGGLFSTAEVRILICYILSSMTYPVPASILCETLHSEGFANAFEVSDSLAYLEENGHIREIENKYRGYVITPKGKSVANTLQTDISIITKERAYAAVLRMTVRFRNERENKFEITHENGHTYLTCSAIDQGFPFFTVKLLVADDNQASYIKSRFLDNAGEYYSKLIEMITRKDDK